ncbi:MAG: single-stranded DNA-binding protein [Oscillospiraceae bacterium]|nr:single-stranded DNA-binding protein [Oscillospiraceae bacterium]
MKTIIINGRLTADPDFKEVGEKSTHMAKFTIANNDFDKDNAEFYDIVCWEKIADFSKEYLRKGNKILIIGSFNNEVYKDKEDKTRIHFSIIANKIEFAD